MTPLPCPLRNTVCSALKAILQSKTNIIVEVSVVGAQLQERERGGERSGEQSQVSDWKSWHPVTDHSLPLNAVAAGPRMAEAWETHWRADWEQRNSTGAGMEEKETRRTSVRPRGCVCVCVCVCVWFVCEGLSLEESIASDACV